MYTNLKEIRVKKNVTAEQMAKLLGLKTKAAYYKKEAGKVKFSIDEAKAISEYFNVSIEKIFFEQIVSH